MNSTLAELIPLALVVAISPIPILAVIMMLLTDYERANPLAYLCGWAVTLSAVVAIAALSGFDSISTTPSTTFAVVLVVVAVVMMILAVHEWRLRPRRGEPHKVEAWMRVLHTITPPRAFGLGVILMIISAKRMLATTQAGAVIGDDSLPLILSIVAAAVFVAISSATLLIPIAVAASFGQRSVPVLHRWRAWLERHGRLVAAAILALVALLLLARGLSVLL